MNLASIANSRIGRPVLVYAFGTACLQVLKQTRTVIEMGFGILDAKIGAEPQIRAAEIDAQPPAQAPADDPTSFTVATAAGRVPVAFLDDDPDDDPEEIPPPPSGPLAE